MTSVASKIRPWCYVASSHVAMLSRPYAVAELIRKAAAQAGFSRHLTARRSGDETSLESGSAADSAVARWRAAAG